MAARKKGFSTTSTLSISGGAQRRPLHAVVGRHALWNE